MQTTNDLQENIDMLNKAIVALYDKDDTKIESQDIEFRLVFNHNRNVYNTSIGLFVDGIRTSLKEKKIEYQCTCGRINKILAKKYIVKTRLRCVHCLEDEEKRRNHSDFWRLGYQPRCMPKHENNDYDFETEDDDFKRLYFIKHWSQDEFNMMLPHIYAINDMILSDVKTIEYIEYEKCYNQFKYVPKIVLDGIKAGIKKVTFKCAVCGELFDISNARPKPKYFKYNKPMCRECLFVNKLFQIKDYVTKFNTHVTYQSKLELKFIKRCEHENIIIENGPIIPYYWNNNNRQYHVDFYLPQTKNMIEIKSNHVWHRQQIKSGKWQAKYNAALSYAKDNKLQYKLLFDMEWDEIFSTNQ